jgi:endoglucanase
MNLLEELSNAFGVSSVEEDVRQIIVDAVKPHVDELRADTMGNLFALRRARQPRAGEPLRVMVTAHMDEVGFLITKITSSGQLKFNTVGGFDPRVLLGKPVVVGPKRLPGVIGMKPVHLLKAGERRKVSSPDSMTIDIGATNASPDGVKPGDFATFATQFSYLGAQPEAETSTRSGRVKGKAFDNRVGCALLVELLQGDYPVDVMGVFTVQEEVGLRGARVAAYSANPDAALVLECTAADDLPRLNEDD